MDSSPDITVQVLIQIRDELRQTKEDANVRFDKLIAEVAQTNRRIDDTNQRIDRTNRQLLNLDARLSTEIGALKDEVRSSVGELRDEVRGSVGELRGSIDELRSVVTGNSRESDEDLRQRVSRCERDIAELRQRG